MTAHWPSNTVIIHGMQIRTVLGISMSEICTFGDAGGCSYHLLVMSA